MEVIYFSFILLFFYMIYKESYFSIYFFFFKICAFFLDQDKEFIKSQFFLFYEEFLLL